MGGAASKQAATKAASAAAKATATASASQATASAAPQAARVVQTTLSPEQIVGAAKAAEAKRAADVVRSPSAPPQFELMEMNQELLKEMNRFQDFERVQFLQQDMDGFKKTASSYRVRSNEPVSLPTDRTMNATNIGEYEKMDGRVTNRDMRFLLRLHYEDPEKWDNETLAAHFGLDAKVLANVLAHVGPPNVLRPLGPTEHPLGIWYDSPQAAAALIAELSAPASLPMPSP